MGVRVSVAGASGYGGGELLRLLAAHPEVELAALAASSNAGQSVTAVHPHLRSLAGRRFDATDPALLADADAVLLSVPHGESGAIAAALPPGVPVLDLGADHRLADADAWATWYGGEHAGAWCYGLPELPGARERLRGATRVALPGCFATAVLLALAPLVAAGLVAATDVVAVAASGVSGAGRTGGGVVSAAEAMGDLVAYKVARHQHVPEVEQELGRLAGSASLSLTTTLAPMPRGILATCTARTTAAEAELRAALGSAYRDEPFVHLLEPGAWPHTAATVGSGSAHLQLALDARPGRVVVVSALDNLGKGASAQAVQVLNLALGLPETLGVPVDGVAP